MYLLVLKVNCSGFESFFNNLTFAGSICNSFECGLAIFSLTDFDKGSSSSSSAESSTELSSFDPSSLELPSGSPSSLLSSSN